MHLDRSADYGRRRGRRVGEEGTGAEAGVAGRAAIGVERRGMAGSQCD